VWCIDIIMAYKPMGSNDVAIDMWYSVTAYSYAHLKYDSSAFSSRSRQKFLLRYCDILTVMFRCSGRTTITVWPLVWPYVGSLGIWSVCPDLYGLSVDFYYIILTGYTYIDGYIANGNSTENNIHTHNNNEYT